MRLALRRALYVYVSLAYVAAAGLSGHAGHAGHQAHAGEVDFNREVRPLLAENCLTCHGQDASSRKAGLRLDTFEGATAALKEGRRAVVPGDADASELLSRVATDDDDVRMPPAKTGKRLTPPQIETLRKWIESGAKYTRHWAFTPLEKPPVPELNDEDAKLAHNDIDAFVLAKLREEGLTPSPQADRRTLIRRVYFDLTGLPPSPEAIEVFVKNESSNAYEALIDQLLASPRYGERWARHWLDLAHYADTHGYDKDKVREHAWPYRDYVIRAFNEDKRYSRFIEEQIAGDVLYPDDPDGIVALGFIAAGPFDWVGHIELGEDQPDKKVVRNLDRDDMVATTMNAFASLTVQCARCHDHKFDPIAQEDYYSLQAVFAAVDRADRPYDTDKELAKRRAAMKQKLDALRAHASLLDERITEQGGEPLAAIRKQLAQLRVQLKEDHPAVGYHSQIESTTDETKWVQVDLGNEVELDQVVLVGAFDMFNNIGVGFGYPVRFRIDACNDPDFASNVTTIVDHTSGDVPNPGVEPQRFEAKALRARYVRVTATKLVNRLENDYIFALAELQAFDRDGHNVALGAKVTAYDTIEAPQRWGMVNLTDGLYRGGAKEKVEQQIIRAEERHHAELTEHVDAALLRERDNVANDIEKTMAALDTLPAQQLVYAAATDFQSIGSFSPTKGQPREIHLLHRGSEKNPGKLVGPGTVGMLDGLPSRFTDSAHEGEAARRAALAGWLTDRNNPLTWRSIVNRVWQHHFGKPIVGTPNDFGKMGQTPSHEALLDYLAVGFRDDGQSFKRLHKQMLMSATYRQASVGDAANQAIDASNRYLWRMNRRKLEAEAVRDSVLTVAGKLDLEMGGPGFFAFGFVDDHSPHYKYHEYDPDDTASHRRSIYRFIVRSVPDPFMETLDCADPSLSVARRLETMTALQALSMMNNPFMVRMAEHAAARAREMSNTLQGQIAEIFKVALGRPPTDEEVDVLVRLAKERGLSNVCRLIFNLNEFVFVD